MNTFIGYDYTLCREDGCKKKDTCMRYLTLQKIKQKGESCLVTVYRPKEVPEDCDMYFRVKEETKL